MAISRRVLPEMVSRKQRSAVLPDGQKCLRIQGILVKNSLSGIPVGNVPAELWLQERSATYLFGVL